MFKKFLDIQPSAGWTKRVTTIEQRYHMVIEKDEEFDLFTVMERPTFVAPIHVRQDGSTDVNLDEFEAWNTDVSIDSVIV